MERVEFEEAARRLSTHPDEVLRAVNDGRLDGWLSGRVVVVDIAQAGGLGLPRVDWVPIHEYADNVERPRPDVVSDVRGGTLDGLIVNQMRRWVFVRP